MRHLLLVLCAFVAFGCGEHATGGHVPRLAVQGLQARSAAAAHARALALDPESRRHGAAVAWLVQNPSLAHAALVRQLEAREPGWRHVPALLARLGQPEGVAPLASAVQTGQPALALEAAGALGRHPDPGATTALITMLDAPHPDVVRAALHGLAVRRDLGTCPALVSALDHTSGVVRDAALEAGLEMACVPADRLDALAADVNPGVAMRARRARRARDADRLASASVQPLP